MLSRGCCARNHFACHLRGGGGISSDCGGAAVSVWHSASGMPCRHTRAHNYTLAQQNQLVASYYDYWKSRWLVADPAGDGWASWMRQITRFGVMRWGGWKWVRKQSAAVPEFSTAVLAMVGASLLVTGGRRRSMQSKGKAAGNRSRSRLGNAQVSAAGLFRYNGFGGQRDWRVDSTLRILLL